MRIAASHTPGRKVNAYKAEVVEQALLQVGYELRSLEEAANVYTINTCSVTNVTDRKSRQTLHRTKSLNSGAVVVATGCYAQATAESLKEDGSVDLVLDNREKKGPVRILDVYFVEKPETPFAVGDMCAAAQYKDPTVNRSEGRARAFLKVQSDCDQYCSYRIIPLPHGNIRSHRPGDIRREAEHLAASGVWELVLTDTHLSSYRCDFKNAAEWEGSDDGAANLLELLTLLDGAEGIGWFRIGSLKPRIATSDFATGLASLRHFCPHFHLPLQSGNNTTLRRMGCRCIAEEFRVGVEVLRVVSPDAAMTTDVIVSFPGKSEEKFSRSSSSIEEIRFYETHIFPYSEQEGARTTAVPEQVPGAVKKRRATPSQELNLRRQRELRTSRLGTAQEMLSKEAVTVDGQAYLVGNSRECVKLAAPLSAPGGGRTVNCLCRGTAGNFLNSEIFLLTDINKT